MIKGRKHRNVEFIQLLKEMSNTEKLSEFAKLCETQSSNMSNYLKGRVRPGKRVLERCAENVFGWSVKPLMEIEPLPENLNKLPKKAGVYILYDSLGSVIYVGKAANFRAEVRQTLGREVEVGFRTAPKLKKEKPPMYDIACFLSLYEIKSSTLRHNFEVLLLRTFSNQTHNKNIGKFK